MTGRSSPFRETKFSGAYRDREIFFLSLADHGQDWQLYPVDSYSAICDTIQTYIHIYTY